MLARAAGANPLILWVKWLMLAHVKLQNSVLNLRTVYKIRLKASWLPTCLFSTSVRQTLPALLLPFFLNYSSLYGSPLLAAQYRGFKKKKKPTSSKRGYKDICFGDLEILQVRHLCQSGRAGRAQVELLAGRCSIKKTEISSTESKEVGPQLMLQLQQKPSLKQ